MRVDYRWKLNIVQVKNFRVSLLSECMEEGFFVGNPEPIQVLKLIHGLS